MTRTKRGRRRKSEAEAKRASFNTRLRSELKDSLAADAALAGRSLSEEIEFRLEKSRELGPLLEGTRVTAIFTELARYAHHWRGDGEEWLDDPAKFQIVRDTWHAILDRWAPPPKPDCEDLREAVTLLRLAQAGKSLGARDRLIAYLRDGSRGLAADERKEFLDAADAAVAGKLAPPSENERAKFLSGPILTGRSRRQRAAAS
jgi:hypothetical protein